MALAFPAALAVEELGQQECPKMLLFTVKFDLSYTRAAYGNSEEFDCFSL